MQSRYLGHGVEFDINDDEDQGGDEFEEEEKLLPKIADADEAGAQPLSCAG